MEITEQNRKLVKAFLKILMNIGVTEETAGAIVTMLKNEEQMDEVVRYIEQNPQATEREIFDKVREITGI